MAWLLRQMTRLSLLLAITLSLALWVYVTLFDESAAALDEDVNLAVVARAGLRAANYVSAGTHVTDFRIDGTVYTKHLLLNFPSQDTHVQTALGWSVVASLSPSVEAEAREMFQDSYGECGLHALGGALVRHPTTKRLYLMHNLWLDNYYQKRQALREGRTRLFDVLMSYRNSWHENYLLHVEMDDGYSQLSRSRLLELPTPTNLEFFHESDGPMDPKYVNVGGQLYLTYYTWSREKTTSGDTVAGRIHVWDVQRKAKINLHVTGIDLGLSETGWAPFVTNDSLYFVYSFVPLRILKCAAHRGQCHATDAATSGSEFSVNGFSGRLTSGTALVEYRYPYYIGIVHEDLGEAEPDVRLHLRTSAPRLVVVSVDPWQVAYISQRLPANSSWLNSVPNARLHSSPEPMWRPTAVLLVDADTLDMSSQLNHHSSYVIRLRGIRHIMQMVRRTRSN